MQAGKQRAEQCAPAPGLKSLTYMPGLADDGRSFEPSRAAELTSLERLHLMSVTKIKKGDTFQCPALRKLCLWDCHQDFKSAILPSGLPSLTELEIDKRKIDIDTFHQQGKLITK